MNTQTFVGNLVADPEIRVGAQSGKRRLNFRLAINEGSGENEKSYFLDFVAWDDLAENIANSMHKGQRMIVNTRVETYQKQFQRDDGSPVNLTFTNYKVIAAGPDLRWAQAKVARVYRDRSEDGDGPQTPQQDSNQQEPPPQTEKPKASSNGSRPRSRQTTPSEAEDF